MAEDKPLKKPLTDDQQDFLMDYLLEKYMDDLRKDEMRREDFYNQGPKTDPKGKPILSANMGGMISIDQMTSPLMMAPGGEVKSKNILLNKINQTKNVGSLINEIGGSASSVGMGQDLKGPGFETAIDTQPGTRVSTSYDNVGGKVKRDFIKEGNLQIKNVTPKVSGVENVNVGKKGPPLLKGTTASAGKKYVNNVISYVQGMGDDISAKGVSSGSFMGATKYGELRNETIEAAKKDPKVLKKYFTQLSGKEAEKAKLFINGKAYKLNVKTFNPFFEKKTGYVPKTDTKNFVKMVDQEITKKGGKLSGKTQLVKDFILNEANRLLRIGDKVGAKTILTALATSIPAIVKALPLGPIDYLIPTTMGSGELPKEGTPEYEEFMKSMGKNQGGMMDINYMTRPTGYKEGTREGTLVGDKEELPVREIVKEKPEGIMGNLKAFFSKKNLGTMENPLPLNMIFEPGIKQKDLIDEETYITTPDGITFKATPFMFDKYLGTKYVENNVFGSRDDVEVEFRPKYITPEEKSFMKPGGMYDQIQTPRKEGTFTEMNQGGIMDINQLTKRIR